MFQSLTLAADAMIVAAVGLVAFVSGIALALGVSNFWKFLRGFFDALNRLDSEVTPVIFDPAGDELGEPIPPAPPPSRRTTP